jgi:ParG protein
MTARPPVPPAADKWVSERVQKTAPTGPIGRLTIDIAQAKRNRFKALCAQRGLRMADEIRTLIENRITELEGQGSR